MTSVYETADQLLKTGDDASIVRALALLRAEVEARPDDSKARFEYAGAFDYLGREAEALPHYQAVLAAGPGRLPADDRPRLYLQLGSTLRNLRRFEESREVLTRGLAEHPDFLALRAFLALTEYSAGDPERSITLLLEALMEKPAQPSIERYSRALRYYTRQLKQKS